MWLYKKKYAFMTNYVWTVFLRQDLVNGRVKLFYSNAIPNDARLNSVSRQVSVRACMLYLTRRPLKTRLLTVKNTLLWKIGLDRNPRCQERPERMILGKTRQGNVAHTQTNILDQLAALHKPNRSPGQQPPVKRKQIIHGRPEVKTKQRIRSVRLSRVKESILYAQSLGKLRESHVTCILVSFAACCPPVVILLLLPCHCHCCFCYSCCCFSC